jgi:hypothetical protein
MLGQNISQAINVCIYVIFNSPFISHPKVNAVLEYYC